MKKHLMRLAVLLMVAGMLTVTIQVAIPHGALAQTSFSDLTAQEAAFNFTSLPSKATNAQADTMQTGTRDWGFFFGNRSPSSVTNPTVSVQSGYNPSQYNFTWQNQPVTAFPVTDSQISLPSGQVFAAGSPGLVSNIPVNYTLGYNSTRKVSPPKIHTGGANQTVTITITLTDSRYVSTSNVFTNLLVDIGSNLPGVSLVSTTNPNNLNQGEMLQTQVSPFGLFEWTLGFPQLNKLYSFSAVLHVPNASRMPFTYQPFVNMSGQRNTVICSECTGTSVTVADATLDGNVGGSGSATFSAIETGHMWTKAHTDGYGILYNGT